MERSGQQKTLLEDLGFLIVILRLVTPGTDFPIPVHRSSASYIRPTSLQSPAAMAPRLPKEVGAALELAIKITHSKGKRPDLENIALIFDTTYQSVSQIRRRINTIAVTGIDPRKKPGPKALGGADKDEVERCIRGMTETNPQVELKEISRVIEERFGTAVHYTNLSRFIKARNIPFIGGKGGPKKQVGRGSSKNGSSSHPRVAERQHLISEGTSGAEDRTIYNSPYAPTMVEQNADNLGSIYGGPGQDHVAYGPYS
jgi:transposase